MSALSKPKYVLLIFFAIFTYFYGLSSLYIPKNGDENPYMHITRMTAATDHLLPLQSELDNMRNTKPPLLFWQGMASTQNGVYWNLFDLRFPNVIYTFLTALFLFFVVRRFSKTETGILAAVIWLSFLGTYRYGRPFLTEPPEIFWLSLPFFALLYWGKSVLESRWLFPIASAFSLGIALLYKSFFYVVPVCFALLLWFACMRHWQVRVILKRDFYKLMFIGFFSLGIFSLWFWLDPSPETIWREFVLGENVGKIDPYAGSYLEHLLWGRKSLWAFILATLINGGFFFFVLIALCWQTFRKSSSWSLQEKLLWLLIFAFFFAFSLPSHRSGRYLLPIMPALAVLIALKWQELPKWCFHFALVMQGVLLLLFAWFGWGLEDSRWLNNQVWHYPFWHWIILLVSGVMILFGLFSQNNSKWLALLGSFLCYVALVSSLSPLDGPLGHYSPETMTKVSNQEVWIPCSFRAKDEEYRILLPNTELIGFSVKEAKDLKTLANRYSMFVAYVPFGEKPDLCEECQILGGRVHMLTRQRKGEMKEILFGKIGTYLLVNEYLIQSPVETAAKERLFNACA